MTNEERDIITRFIERVGGSQGAISAAGSVPGSVPALPPVDREADSLINDLFARYPEARYRITQTAFVQEHALAEAQNRIRALEWQLAQAKQSPAAAPAAPQSRGFLGSIFGGGAPQPQPQYQQPQYQGGPPPPQYAPGYQPGMFQRSGSGFLGSALTTAAGVAGGLVVGNALMGMFSPHEGIGGGLGAGSGAFGGGGGAPVDSPWGSAASSSDGGGVAGGAWDNQTESSDPGASSLGGGGWDNASGSSDSGGGWDSSDSSGGGGGWDDNT